MSENQKSPIPDNARKELARRKFLIGVNATLSALSAILGMSAASLGQPELTQPLIGFGVAGGLGIMVQLQHYFDAEREHGIDVLPTTLDKTPRTDLPNTSTTEKRKNPIKIFRREKDTLGDNIKGGDPKDMEDQDNKFGG